MVHKLRMDELRRPSLSQFIQSPKLPFIFICDNIRSALNVGSILRSADAFAVQRVILVGITQTPPHKEILKTALGAEKSVSWSYEQTLIGAIRNVKEEGFMVIGIEQTTRSKSLAAYHFYPEHKVAFIFGNEVSGVASEGLELCDDWLEIPQSGTKHSLNVAVSAGIIGWEFYKQHLHCK